MPEERDVFSNQSFAIQITLKRPASGPATVSRVFIGNRPPGLYGSSTKSHLVPWLAFCDGLRADVVGQTMPDAMVRVAHLIDWTAGLPSQGLSDSLRRMTLAELKKAVKVEKGADDDTDGDGETQTGTPSVWHGLADEHATAMGAAARKYAGQWGGPNGGEDAEARILQNVIVACLHYRNTVPLAAVAMPNPLGPPTKAANTVRGWEAKLAAAPDTVIAPPDQDTLIKALWGLLDTKATAYLADNPALVMDLKTLEVDPGTLPAFVVADHVLTMEQVYPGCCAKSGFRNTINVVFSGNLATDARKIVATASQPSVTHGNRKVSPGTGTVAVSDNNNMDLDEGADTGGGTSDYDRFAVQLDLADDGTISRMYVGQRPKSGKGRHSTAWVALCDYVRRVVTGKTVTQVATALEAQRQIIAKLAAGQHYPDQVLPDRPGPTATLVDAQLKIGEFLSDLNAMPGAIADTGGTSGGGAENRLRANIGSDGAQLSDLLELLDSKCLLFEYDDKSDMAVGLALRAVLHLYLVGTAYPEVATHLGLVSEQALAMMLFPVGVPEDMAGVIGAMVMGSLRPTAAFDLKTYRQASGQYSSDRLRLAKTRGQARDKDDNNTEYRPSQDSQASPSSEGSFSLGSPSSQGSPQGETMEIDVDVDVDDGKMEG